MSLESTKSILMKLDDELINTRTMQEKVKIHSKGSLLGKKISGLSAWILITLWRVDAMSEAEFVEYAEKKRMTNEQQIKEAFESLVSHGLIEKKEERYHPLCSKEEVSKKDLNHIYDIIYLNKQ